MVLQKKNATSACSTSRQATHVLEGEQKVCATMTMLGQQQVFKIFLQSALRTRRRGPGELVRSRVPSKRGFRLCAFCATTSKRGQTCLPKCSRSGRTRPLGVIGVFLARSCKEGAGFTLHAQCTFDRKGEESAGQQWNHNDSDQGGVGQRVMKEHLF